MGINGLFDLYKSISIYLYVTIHITGSPSSKYEHRRTWASLRNIRNIRICMEKNLSFSVTYENERISLKNSSPYIKSVLRLSSMAHGPIYGRFMGCNVNGFLSI